MTPLTGTNATSNGPWSRAICHQLPCHWVSPQWMTRRPVPSTTQATWSQSLPRQSSEVTGVTVSSPMRRDWPRSWATGVMPTSCSAAALGVWQPIVPVAAIRAIRSWS